VTIAAHNEGNITQTAGTVSGNTVNLSSGFGSMGSFNTPFPLPRHISV